jgi:hypothetical protein
MKFEIHFEFIASLRKFQDLNFRDATVAYINWLCIKPGLAFKCWGCGKILCGRLGSSLLDFLVDSYLLGNEHVLSVSEVAI